MRDIGHHGSETEVTVRTRVVIVAIAEAVAAMPKEPSPPAVDFSCTPMTRAFVPVHEAVFVLDVLVSSVAVPILNVNDGRSRR